MEQGLMEEESQALLQEFFSSLRQKRLAQKREKKGESDGPV